MYRHPSFAVDDEEFIRSTVAERRLGTLVVTHAGAFEASPLPWLLVGDELHGHVVNANPLVDVCVEGVPCLGVFDVADGYVSPSWYPSKVEHGRVVPTWNYLAVQVHGSVRTVTDPEWIHDQVRSLTDLMEESRPEPWSVSDVPDTFIHKQLSSITGLVVTIDRFEAKAKLSQNRTDADRVAVQLHIGDGRSGVGLAGYMANPSI